MPQDFGKIGSVILVVRVSQVTIDVNQAIGGDFSELGGTFESGCEVQLSIPEYVPLEETADPAYSSVHGQNYL